MKRDYQVVFINPTLANEYAGLRKIPEFDFEAFKFGVEKAQNGDNKCVEETEYTFLYFTVAYNCKYTWSALGMSGLSKKDSLIPILDAIHGSIDYNSLWDMSNICGQMVSTFLYKPLPELW